jgi:hypothetical protein
MFAVSGYRAPFLCAVACVFGAAGLLQGCADPGMANVATVGAMPAKTSNRTPVATDPGKQLASLAIGDAQLGDVRGGVDLGPGIVLNFSFQQATFVNNDLVQNIVVPTITITPGAGMASVASDPLAASAGIRPNVNVPSLAGLSLSGPTRNASAATISSTVLGNGTIQAQINPATLVNNGVTSIVSTIGGGGLTNIVGNTANNQLVQQMTTVDVGISGLSQLLQQSVSTTILNRLAPIAGAIR